MFRKQDFKKVDLLGSGKKNTKIFKAEHLPTGKYFALKEVEAKTIDKLNEYKEEAVQLCKVKNHPNIIQTYGYYFYETQYNTFRLAIVCEFMDDSTNLERVFRKRQQKNSTWKEEELEKLIVSLISTLSYLQSIGICHRDIKPSNLFCTKAGEMKVIDFGESKDYFTDGDDGGDGTLATIRGTPQYLSPILWKAYVVDKNTRHATHNIYKSDVFSSGLVFLQMASLDDVTGFNNINEGEKAIEIALKKLRKKYSEHICEIIRLMLKFDESERPSFVELAKLVLTSEENTLQSPKNDGVDFSEFDPNHKISLGPTIPGNKRDSTDIITSANVSQMRSDSHSFARGDMESSSNYMTQADLFKKYVEQNDLFINFEDSAFWFEFGGQRIGKIELKSTPEQEEPNKWKLMGKYKFEFPMHFSLVFADSVYGFYILGGSGNNCLNFLEQNIIVKASMPEKSFVSAVYLSGKIYTFGGYDNYEKIQLKSCEIYDCESNVWTNNTVQLNTARSQCSSCIYDKTTIYIFGGFSKELGTLSSIEKYDIANGKITPLSVTMPMALRRFVSIKISTTKILLIGGIERMNKESDSVYCFDIETPEYRIERLDKIDRAGVVDYPIIVDSVGNLHLFVENQ